MLFSPVPPRKAGKDNSKESNAVEKNLPGFVVQEFLINYFRCQAYLWELRCAGGAINKRQGAS